MKDCNFVNSIPKQVFFTGLVAYDNSYLESCGRKKIGMQQKECLYTALEPKSQVMNN